MPITAKGRWFIDETGRARILHGVNLSGGSKVPAASRPASTHLPDSLDETRDLSFVRPPLPAGRSRRTLQPASSIGGWTSCASSSPGKRSSTPDPGNTTKTISTTSKQLLEKALEYDIHIFIDPHQDVWSRFSGGDGAPAWTLEAAGMDVDQTA